VKRSRPWWDGFLAALLVMITVIGISLACNLGAYVLGWWPR
jgi:hypothetical protein